ncbi:hypothetical protein DZA35_01210 [Arcobacter sp. HD9-500m-PIT-SAG03]|nr:hypothetical protein DZA35_01210 [Arcobacter sp. HD9-500m-PIT-SAG03]
MFNYTDAILDNIDKLVGTLKGEDELVLVMKRKFTKKELKVFIAMEQKIEISEIAKEIHTDENRVKEIYKAATKKLNQEKIKKELIRSKH